MESKRILPLDLSTIKPLKAEPKKWTLPHVVRALVNGQFQGLRKNYYMTDDYAYDNAVNFREGEISDVIGFVQGIVENPGVGGPVKAPTGQFPFAVILLIQMNLPLS